MKIEINLIISNKNNSMKERLYSTGENYLDELLERAFCDGYEFAQREFANSNVDARLRGAGVSDEQIQAYNKKIDELNKKHRETVRFDKDYHRKRKNTINYPQLSELASDRELVNNEKAQAAAHKKNNADYKQSQKAHRDEYFKEMQEIYGKDWEATGLGKKPSKSKPGESKKDTGKSNNKNNNSNTNSTPSTGSATSILNSTKNKAKAGGNFVSNMWKNSGKLGKAGMIAVPTIAVAGTTLAAIKAAKKRKARKEAEKKRIKDQSED